MKPGRLLSKIQPSISLTDILSHVHAATVRRKMLIVLTITLASMMFGIAYTFLTLTPHQTSAPAWHSYLNGMFVGLFLGLAISFAELSLFQSRLRQLPFVGFLILQTLYYLVVFNVILAVVIPAHMAIFHGMSFMEGMRSPDFTYFYRSGGFILSTVYALGVIVVMSFVREVNRMLGAMSIVHFITGKYHKPVEEERVFMFLDLKGSTAIAESLGHGRYHEFLNDFFYDITPAIIESRGTIYQYVGDEVVVTWTREQGLRDANCITCYFRAVAAIHRLSGKYESKYGFVPGFRTGIHYGRVIVGMMGDIKRDIAFHGDTVNTAARIRSECASVNRPLLISGELLQQLPSITSYLTPENMGRIRLKGKQEEVELFGIKEAM